MGLFFIVLLAIAIFGTGMLIIHAFSLFNKWIKNKGYSRVLLYIFLLLPLLLIGYAIAFPDTMDTLSVNGVVAFSICVTALCMFTADCSYTIAQQKKWNYILLGTHVLIGIFSIGVTIISVISNIQ